MKCRTCNGNASIQRGDEQWDDDCPTCRGDGVEVEGAIDVAELMRWQAVSDGAKANGHQAFRVTPEFFDRVLARLRELEDFAADIAGLTS